jgi:hypothetical protein
MDPPLFFYDFKDAKKNIFPSHFISDNLPTGTLSSFMNILFLLKFCVKMLFCRHYFSPLNTFMRKGKDPELDPDPYLWLITDPADPDPVPDPDPQHW